MGPILNIVKNAGGVGVGVTLSPAQASACRKNGHEAIVKDWKDLDPQSYAGVVSVGAFEHFCSIEEMKAGKQEKIYKDFFKLCHDCLPSKGRLYLQTMMWGKRVPKHPEEFNVNAKKESDSWVLGHVAKFYPGSWLPNGLEHIEKCAKPYFKLVSENNGRLDYIETMKEWGKKCAKLNLKKIWFVLKLLPKWISDKNFRYQVTSLKYSCNRKCFEREIMSHQRMIFEKN